MKRDLNPMGKKINISPSLLSADMARLADAVEMVAGEADYVHCDVMDDHFVPNLTFGPPVIEAVKRLNMTRLDVHLMIESPGRRIDDYLKAGLGDEDFLTFHFEAEPESEKILKYIRDAGVRPGISIKPGTPFEAIESLLYLCDQILIMTVEPGFGGQKFMEDMMPKVSAARKLAKPHQLIAVDGGVDINTARIVVKAGANLLVAGSAIFGKADPVKAIKDIRESLTGIS